MNKLTKEQIKEINDFRELLLTQEEERHNQWCVENEDKDFLDDYNEGQLKVLERLVSDIFYKIHEKNLGYVRTFIRENEIDSFDSTKEIVNRIY